MKKPLKTYMKYFPGIGEVEEFIDNFIREHREVTLLTATCDSLEEFDKAISRPHKFYKDEYYVDVGNISEYKIYQKGDKLVLSSSFPLYGRRVKLKNSVTPQEISKLKKQIREEMELRTRGHIVLEVYEDYFPSLQDLKDYIDIFTKQHRRLTEEVARANLLGYNINELYDDMEIGNKIYHKEDKLFDIDYGKGKYTIYQKDGKLHIGEYFDLYEGHKLIINHATIIDILELKNVMDRIFR